MIKISRILARYILRSLVLLLVAGVVLARDRHTLEVVSQVELDRYVGTWYEVARLPNWFQDQCIGNVTAEYSRLDDGTIEVVNRCLRENGQTDEARGVARIIDISTNAKLEVSFVSLFGWNLLWGDYWILDLGDDYEYAVVGMPSRKYAWILSRSVQLSPEVWGHIRQLLIRAGYDPKQLVETQHE